jgi:D-tyrosyl-tRNA(Tyr) deacylase
MRFLVQRVTRACVRVNGKVEGAIGPGLVVLIGIAANDGVAEADYLAEKLVNLRIFADSDLAACGSADKDSRMNRSALDVNASLLLVSQFTLYGDCRKGRRPSFDAAAPAEKASALYEYTVNKVRGKGLVTETGLFQSHMELELVNDGPVTLLLESQNSIRGLY